MALGVYVLRGHEVVEATDPADRLDAMLSFSDIAARTVRKDHLTDPQTLEKVEISTVFLSIDHGHTNDGPPILFETLVFGGRLNQSMNRYATWDEAEAGHAEMLTEVMRSFKDEQPTAAPSPDQSPTRRRTWHKRILDV